MLLVSADGQEPVGGFRWRTERTAAKDGVMNLTDGCEDNTIEMRIPCRPEYVRTVRRAIAEFAQTNNLPRSAVEEIEIAASEAVANAVRHAYNGKDSTRQVRIKCTQRPRGLVLEVTDKGCGFQVPVGASIPSIDLDTEGGFGITIMRNLMDRVQYVSRPDVGTRVKMTKNLHRKLSDLT
jgi:anti-sigma regulatory factor (Ser/Thr protein kinase)